MPDEKYPIPAGAKAREVTDTEEPLYKRDTLPPSPEKARIIDTAINKEVLNLLETVGEDTESDEVEDDMPSILPPETVPLEKLEEGVQYRIVEPATKLPASGGEASGEAGDSPAVDLEEKRKALTKLESELREREERVLQGEVVLGGREKILKKREEKLHQREVRLRNWEAKLMDREAALRESYPPEGRAEPPSAATKAVQPEPVRTSSASDLRIEIAGGSGAWEMVDEPIDESGDES